MLRRYSLRAKTTASTFVRVIRLYHSNRSLQAWGRLLNHLYLRTRNRPAPRFITIGVTHKCQCRCVHCYSGASRMGKIDELDTDQIKSVIDQARGLGVLEVVFSGGEPLLRDDILELVRHAHQKGLLTRLNSNGLLLTPQTIGKLKQAGLTRCGISIDHPDPDIHDKLRDLPGLHRKALTAVENLIAAGVPCQIQTYASRQIINSGLREIIELGKQRGVMGIYILFPIAAGRWSGAFDEVLTEKERARVRALQDLTCVHLELPTPDTRCCLFTRSILYVSPQGEVSPCPFMPYRLGNIREHILKDLWYEHSAGLNSELKGKCPLNDPLVRESIRNHVESVRQSVIRSDRGARPGSLEIPGGAPGEGPTS